MLQLSDKITRDINSNQTSITPLIVVNNSIYISTVKGVFDTGRAFGEYRYWEDRNLKLSSIKESVDLIDRNFKINNLSFSINNYPLNGIRFSDFVSEESLINKYVDVYYKTPSCETLEDCILVTILSPKYLSHISWLLYSLPNCFIFSYCSRYSKPPTDDLKTVAFFSLPS